jgi:regulator of sigma E protease
MPEDKNGQKVNSHKIIWLAIAAFLIYLIANNPDTAVKILLVIIGFGSMVLIHELGHFTFAKLSKIKVEAFSMGLPPTALGIMRTEKGWRIRILPFLINKEKEETGESGHIIYLGGKQKPGETEYQIGAIPFGGFVKMLGQEDFGEAKRTDDPRSYTNKPPHTRLAVIAGGVMFNMISAVIFFIIAFMIGVDSPPAVVGGVVPGYSAEKAGLVPGDEVIEIDGKRKDLEFSDISISALLSEEYRQVPFKVKHADGSIEKVYLTAEKKLENNDEQPMFGIAQPLSLIIRDLSPEDTNDLFGKTGLKPGDKIISANNNDIEHYWQLEDILSGFPEKVSLLAQRQTKEDQTELIETTLSTPIIANHICSMVPLIKVKDAEAPPKPGFFNKFLTSIKKLISKTGLIDEPADYRFELQTGDIIIGMADVNYPTFKQQTDITKLYNNKELPLKVIRKQSDNTERVLNITATPFRKGENVIIGFTRIHDFEKPIIAHTIETKTSLDKLDIPPGSTITKVNGANVSSFFDIVKHLKNHKDTKYTIKFTDTMGKKGSVSFETQNINELIDAKPFLDIDIPFAPLEKTYKASGPVDAVSMGLRKTWRFIKISYASIKAMFTGKVSAKNASGPVGILYMSYQVVSNYPPAFCFYFLGLISIAISVFNFLPFPPLDGGLAVFLLIEKLKGSPVSPKIQLALAGFGWILIGALAIYITINDVLKIFTGFF